MNNKQDHEAEYRAGLESLLRGISRLQDVMTEFTQAHQGLPHDLDIILGKLYYTSGEHLGSLRRLATQRYGEIVWEEERKREGKQ